MHIHLKHVPAYSFFFFTFKFPPSTFRSFLFYFDVSDVMLFSPHLHDSCAGNARESFRFYSFTLYVIVVYSHREVSYRVSTVSGS